MKFFAKENLQFFKSNFQLVYGVALLVLVPAALVINSLIFINNTQTVIDTELQKEASLATSIFGAAVTDVLAEKNVLQQKIEGLARSNEELKAIDVLVPKGEDFQVVASLEATAISTTSKYLYNTIAWRTEEAVAFSTTSPARSTQNQQGKSDERFWVVVQPVKDEAGQKVAVVAMKISSKVIDDLARSTLNRSLLVLVISILIIVLLLINNTRLFQYAVLARRLREVDRMKDEFISMASHELRAPIVGIRGYLQMIADKSFGELPPAAFDKVKLILKESDRLRDLVEDLLDVSRIEQGRVKFEFKPLNIALIFDEIIDSFAKPARDQGLQLKTDLKANLPPIYADENKFKQVIINLVNNAIKYTSQGSVTLSAETKEEMIKIKISDTGMGMTAKDRERLFEKFYRVRNEKTDSIGGTGLGLWITRELVRLMKGDIYVDSMENVGTQVTILLPAVKEKK